MQEVLRLVMLLCEETVSVCRFSQIDDMQQRHPGLQGRSFKVVGLPKIRQFHVLQPVSIQALQRK